MFEEIEKNLEALRETQIYGFGKLLNFQQFYEIKYPSKSLNYNAQ